jgi:hypothetical protein
MAAILENTSPLSLLIKSAPIASSSPRVRKWLIDLLRRGERAGNTVEASTVRSKRRERELDRAGT